jgi:hypothetical protein
MMASFQIDPSTISDGGVPVAAAVIAVVALIVTFGSPIIIVASVLLYRMRKTRLTHDTILKLAEKGVPIPPELIAAPQRDTPKSDLKTGIILLSAGAGLMLFFFEVGAPSSLAAIPALMGIGYLVAWKIEKSQQSGA